MSELEQLQGKYTILVEKESLMKEDAAQMKIKELYAMIDQKNATITGLQEDKEQLQNTNETIVGEKEQLISEKDDLKATICSLNLA